MTLKSRNLIAALHDILSKLELMESSGRDEEAFAELKRIVNQRIQDLQNPASIPSIIPGLKRPNTNADTTTHLLRVI
ncbi:MAG TPA: hypothetical protein VMD55_13485 [Terracidiphilus sp.]|nr:hypothetical protein [Terracidiphilus sp.]